MTVTWGGIRDWNAESVEDAAQLIQRRAEQLAKLADELNWQHPVGWHGEASERARDARRALVRRFDDVDNEVDPLKRALREASDAIAGLQREHDDLDQLARSNDMLITPAGDLLTDTGTGPMPGTPEAADRTELALHLRDEIARITTAATTIDDQLAAALRRAAFPANYPDANGNQSRLNPPPDGNPQQVNDWWLGLSEDERNELMATNPSFVGSTDGIPAEYRDTANRQLLTTQQADLNADINQLRADAAKARDAGRLLDLVSIANKIKDLEAKSRGLDAIKNRIDNPKPGQPQAYLLGIDTDAGQAIVAIGNPDTATNVATFVPGTGAGLGSINTDMSRADRMAQAADDADSPSTSVITWVGYDAPQNLLEAADPSYADNAEKDLDQFQDGLRATHEGTPSHNTVIGHSYGSTVIGHAASNERLDVDDVVFVGSPGVGVDNAADLNIPAEHVHATVAEHDIIKLSNIDDGFIPGIDTDIHGPDPTGDGFGASVFESDPGTQGPLYQGGLSTEAHSQYWDDGNKALENMGLIIAGKPTI